MKEIVNIDGVLTPATEAKISVFDHGFLFGDSIYETMHTLDRRVVLISRHLKRLQTSADMMRINLPLSIPDLEREIVKTVEQTDRLQECYLRLVITRGIGKMHLDIDLSLKAGYVIIVLPYEPPPARYYREGVKVAFVSIRRNDPTALNPKIKASNLLNNVMAYIQAKEQQAYEGLFCNLSGHITECTSSNFFVVKRGTLITPAPGAGLLEGVVRGLTLELAAANSIPIKEMDLLPQDCLEADESFITSSLKGIMPVRQLGEKPFSPIPGPVTKILMDAYRQYIKAGKT